MMAKQQKRFLILQIAFVVIALMILSSGLSELRLRPGESLHLWQIFLQNLRAGGETAAPILPSGEEAGAMIDLLTIIFWVTIPFAVIYAIISPRYRRTLFRTFVTIFILLYLFNNWPKDALSPEDLAALEAGNAALENADFALPDPPSFVTNPPDWLFIFVNGLLGLLLFASFWYVWRRLRPKPDTQTLFVQEAEKALSALEAGGNLKDVVLRCYAQMSAVLRESKKVERRRAMTPREFERHLVGMGVGDEHIRRLTRLFEAVRYGAKVSDEQAEGEAKACLSAIVQAYGEPL